MVYDVFLPDAVRLSRDVGDRGGQAREAISSNSPSRLRKPITMAREKEMLSRASMSGTLRERMLARNAIIHSGGIIVCPLIVTSKGIEILIKPCSVKQVSACIVSFSFQSL